MNELINEIIEGRYHNDLRHYDYLELLSLHKKLWKRKHDLKGQPIKIAIIGSKSIQLFVKTIEVLLISRGYLPEIYEGEYNGIISEIINDDSDLYKFSPQYTIILTHHTDIHTYPPLLSSHTELKSWISDHTRYYQQLHEKLESLNCCVIQSLFVVPDIQVLNQLESNVLYSENMLLKMLNIELVMNKKPFVHYIDLDTLASSIGKRKWFDHKGYYLHKAPFDYEYLPDVAHLFVNRIDSLEGRIKKCIVLDLDNTLWGGVIGDEGAQGININQSDPIGEAYLDFQKYLLQLKDRGIVLTICSKNDEDNAKSAFIENENMILKLDDIAVFKANWDDKASNIQLIADELNIGVNSLVFVDDNPAERQIVRQFLPTVCVIELDDDPVNYKQNVNDALCFDWPTLTREDLNRVDTYKDNARRLSMSQSFVNYDDYLKSLEMEASLKEVTHDDISRYVQLTNKSNQFNLRTMRLQENQVLSMLKDDHYKLLYVTLKDCFSSFGIISCLILKKDGDICFIENWLMSCRVLKRDVEVYVLNQLVLIASKWGCTQLVGEYIPTTKNKMVENFYPSLGFVQNGHLYELNLDHYESKKTYIKGDV